MEKWILLMIGFELPKYSCVSWIRRCFEVLFGCLSLMARLVSEFKVYYSLFVV